MTTLQEAVQYVSQNPGQIMMTDSGVAVIDLNDTVHLEEARAAGYQIHTVWKHKSRSCEAEYRDPDREKLFGGIWATD